MAWAPDYCTVTDLKHYVSVEDDADEDEMLLAIAAASRAIDRTCNRQFGQDNAPTARYFTASYAAPTRQWIVPIDDVMTSTGLAVDSDSAGDFTFTTALTGHRLYPLNAAVTGRPWTSLVLSAGSGATPTAAPGGVRVTAQFGWSGVPEAVVQATLMQASRFLARRGAPFGIAGSPDAGSEMRLLARVDPDVEVALAPFRRQWAAA